MDQHSERTLGLICSVQCPASVILQLYDAIRALRDAGVHVVGGFHSPMERECLELLLRGQQPVTVVLPRPRVLLPAAWKPAVTGGRLSILTARTEESRRTTAALAHQRNQFVVSAATALFVPHASPGGKVELLVMSELASGKDVLTFEDPSNERLLAAGARMVTAESIVPALVMLESRAPAAGER